MSPNSPALTMASRSGPVDHYRVYMLGGPGVGKTALISQFRTSECINAYEDTGLFNSNAILAFSFWYLLMRVLGLIHFGDDDHSELYIPWIPIHL